MAASAAEMALAAALDWSAQQTRILTANGKANEYYTAQRGFPFDETELPHYHLLRRKEKKVDDASRCNNETHARFRKWAILKQQQKQSFSIPFSIVGAWKRTVFYITELEQQQQRSTDATETTYNIQTNTLFVDLRLPIATRRILCDQLSSLHNNTSRLSLQDLNAQQLRLYARQHVFAGFTHIQAVVSKDTAPTSAAASATAAATPAVDAQLLCTRHHCIDWNFVGTARARPNKWWVEPIVVEEEDAAAWNEWAYATNHQGQHYYCERWERLNYFTSDTSCGGGSSRDNDDASGMDPEATTQRLVDNLILTLRKLPPTSAAAATTTQEYDDGVIVCVGNQFNYCLCTRPPQSGDDRGGDKKNRFSSLVELVDDAVARGDLNYARAWLSRIQAGHGYMATGSGGGWKVNAAIPQWHEEDEDEPSGDNRQKAASPLWQSRDEIKVILVSSATTMSNHGDDDGIVSPTTNMISSWTSDYCVSYKGELWEILECNLATKVQLETILWLGLTSDASTSSTSRL